MTGCVREAELEAALDGRLDGDVAQQVLAHARGCLRCRAARDELEALAQTARALPPHEPDEVRARRVRGAVLGAALMGPRPVPRASRWRVAAAACAVALAGVGLWSQRHRDARAVTATVAADPRRVDLAGAGSLWPAPDAQVLVRSAGPDTRIELWQGAVTLQVNRRRAGERFVVQLADAEVEVHGTRFTVLADRGHLARVDVTEGVVAVRHTGDPERLLAAGSHLILPTATAVASNAPGEAPTVTATATRAQPTPDTPPAMDPGVWFREGSLAFARGDHAEAVRALGRFRATAPRSDPRREDACYLRVLSLHALGRVEPLRLEAEAYQREFRRGVRGPEVVLALVTSLASSGRCDEAARAARAMPADAPARLRDAVDRALRCAAE